MIPRLPLAQILWLPLVFAALLAIYLPGLANPPLFDDEYLASGRLYADYASLLDLRARMLSYGSFGWVQSILGEGWWKQRLVNLAIHVATVIALWALYRELLRHVQGPAPEPGDEAVPVAPHESPAIGLAVAFFALNPVAAYAVGYLIQRSILLATLFVVLGLWCFARGLRVGKPLLHGAAVACYALAVLSKEHALFAPLAAIPVYILVARPKAPRLAMLAGGLALLAAAAGFALSLRYGEIIGKPFDEYSHVYLAQLAALAPDAPKNAFGLSVLNQAYLFFEYGLRWFVPWSGWMSINLRPPFPVAWTTFPQVLGIVGYLATIAGGFFLLLRYRDARALAGVALLFASLLFATEFVTVWVQDPFVLYRSYLWAIAIPGLVFVVVNGPSGRVLLVVGAILGVLLGWQAIDRVLSMRSPEAAWTDAIAKLPNDPRSVGRWFPYLNRGADRFERDQVALAQADFERSASLGDLGMGAMNLGSLLSSQGRHAQALGAFAAAEKQGYTLYNLNVQRGLAFQAMNRPAEAYREFQAAAAKNPPSPTREIVALQLGRMAIQVGKPAEAVTALERLVASKPTDREARYNLGMALVASGNPARAEEILSKLIAEEPGGRLYYARALARYGLKRKADAAADLESARRIVGDSPHLAEWAAKIQALP